MSARQPRNKDVDLWKPQDVSDWFRQNKLEDCAAIAWRNKIDGKTLLALQPSVLQMFPEKARMKVQSLTKTLGEQPRHHWNKFSGKQTVQSPPDKDYTAQLPAHTGDGWSENEFDSEDDDDYEEPDADQSLPQCTKSTQESSEDDNYEEPDGDGPDYDDPSKIEDEYEQTPCETQKYPPLAATSIGGNDKGYIDKGSISIKVRKNTSSGLPSDNVDDQEDYVVPVENVPNEGCLPSLPMRPGTKLKPHEKPTPLFPHSLPPKPVLDGSPPLHKPLLPSTPKPGSDNSQVFLKTRSLEKALHQSINTTNPHTLPKNFKDTQKLPSYRLHPPQQAPKPGGAPVCPQKPNFNAAAPTKQVIPGGGGPAFGRKVNNGHVSDKPIKPKGCSPMGHASMHGPPPILAGHRPLRKSSHDGFTPPAFLQRHQHVPRPEDTHADPASDSEDYEIPNEEEKKEIPPKISDHMNRYPLQTPPPPSRPAPLGPPPVDRVSKPNTGGRPPLSNKDSPSEITAMPRSPLLPQLGRKPGLHSGSQAGHKPHLSPGSVKRSEEDPRMCPGDTGPRHSFGHSPSFANRGGAAVGPPHSAAAEINNCDRKTAEATVKMTNKDGAFMVRTSSKDKTNQPYTLVIYYEEKIFNIPIRYLEKQKKYALGMEKANEEKFDSIQDIIEHYKTLPLLLIGGQHGIKKSTLLIHQVRI